MRMQDETPEAWYVDLVSYDLNDAMEAARVATLDKAFIAIGDLTAECDRIVRRREGAARQAALQAQIEAENAGELTGRERPLRALMAGSEIKSAPRPSWNDRRALPPRPTKPPLTDEELAAARAELEAASHGGTA